MPSGKEIMWLGIGIVIGWFVIPHLMGMAGKKADASPGY